MRKLLLILILLCSSSYATVENKNIDEFQVFITQQMGAVGLISPISTARPTFCKIHIASLSELRKLLYLHADTLRPEVIKTVLTAIQCARQHQQQYSRTLTIIDYSLPSNQKRLWVFDLRKMELVFFTYVTHGIRSGSLDTNYFSNKFNDKTSSLGIFTTGNAYIGRHGLSLKLFGLERKFNDLSYQRSIVLHAAWYVDKAFAAKYGRIGRSWGCPAVPENLVKPIINLIQGQSLLIAYYPSKEWFSSSKFLNCAGASFASSTIINLQDISEVPDTEHRGEVIYVDKNNNDQRQENEPVLVMSAENYQYIFKSVAPLKRMLRAQINNTEYVALDNEELAALDTNNDNVINDLDQYDLQNIALVIPNVINVRGYYTTQFNFVDPGKIQEITLDLPPDTGAQQQFAGKIYFTNNSSMNLKYTNDFIRWVGL